MLTQEAALQVYLTVSIVASVLAEGLDSLSNTSLYKHDVKLLAKRLDKALHSEIIRDLELTVKGKSREEAEAHSKKMYTLYNYIERRAIQMATMKPEDIGIEAHVVTMLMQDREGVMCKLGIVEVDEVPEVLAEGDTM